MLLISVDSKDFYIMQEFHSLMLSSILWKSLLRFPSSDKCFILKADEAYLHETHVTFV